MKIVFLTPNLEMHGGNLVLLKHANFLAEEGHEVSIISSDRKTLTDINPKINLLLYKSFPIKYVDYFFLQRIYFKKIFRLIEECDFIIPIYTPLLPIAIHAKRKKKLNAKIVLLYQDFFGMIWAGRFIKKIVSAKKYCKEVVLAVCVSNNSKKSLEEVSSINTKVVHPGIELKLFSQRPKKKKYILFVGRPDTPPKGFIYFKQAFEICRKQFPNLQAIVVSPSNVKHHDIGIEYVQYKSRNQLAGYFTRALIYVSASLGDNFGVPPLEAMASNTAVILTDNDSSREYALDQKNCLMVPMRDGERLSQAIIKLLQDGKLREKLQKNGLITVQKFSWERSLKKFYQILLSLNHR